MPIALIGLPVMAAPVSSASAPAEASVLGSLLQVTLALGLVLGMIVFAAWLMRRFSLMPRATGGMMRVVSGVMIGQRERVVIVEVRDQWLVLGVTPQTVNLLSTMPKLDDHASQTESSVPSFAERLALVMQKRIRPDSVRTGQS